MKRFNPPVYWAVFNQNGNANSFSLSYYRADAIDKYCTVMGWGPDWKACKKKMGVYAARAIITEVK